MCAVNISIRCMTVYMYMYNIIYIARFILNSYLYDPLCPIQMSCSDFSLRDSCKHNLHVQLYLSMANESCPAQILSAFAICIALS